MNPLVGFATVFSALLVLTGPACFQPKYYDGGWACGDGESCPAGFECNPADNLCYREGTVGADGGEVDGGDVVDAAVADAPPNRTDASPADASAPDVLRLTDCSDGLDNDSDGLADTNDPGCEDAYDPSESSGSACDDGADNDGDGRVDVRGDGTGDPGCDSPSDLDEHGAVECDNGIDDDSDGEVDRLDPDCDSLLDPTEARDICPPGDTGIDDGLNHVTTGADPGRFDAPSACFLSASTASYGDASFVYYVTNTLRLLSFSTKSDFDTVAWARVGCTDALACNDNFSGHNSWVALGSPPPQPVILIIDGKATGAFGPVDLTVSGQVEIGGTCDPADVFFPCGPGATCQRGTCVRAACANFDDDDGDGKNDPLDPGCYSPSDPDETDGPVLPQCADGIDNDGDGDIDKGADIDCRLAGAGVERGCRDIDVVDITYSGGVYVGTTLGAGDEHAATCATTASPDVVHALSLPGRADLTVDTCDGTPFDTVVYVKRFCDSVQLDCNDDGVSDPACGTRSRVTGLVDPDTYFIFVEGYGANAGPYRLRVSGTIHDGELCDPAQVVPGFLQCNTGKSCRETSGQYRCI